jgi:hypothetical protein
MGDHPSCHHDASVRSILEEDPAAKASKRKKEVAHPTWDSYDALPLSFCARVHTHLFFFFFQNLYRLLQGASI